jgi:hypothetical protein
MKEHTPRRITIDLNRNVTFPGCDQAGKHDLQRKEHTPRRITIDLNRIATFPGCDQATKRDLRKKNNLRRGAPLSMKFAHRRASILACGHNLERLCYIF